MKFLKSKLLTVALSVAIGLSAFAPTYAFATENNAITSPIVNQSSANSSVEQRIVETQGLKKTLLIKGLREGGKALDELFDWLGWQSKEAKYVSENADAIADFLEKATGQFEKELLDFLIFDIGIPQGPARVITFAISGIIS